MLDWAVYLLRCADGTLYCGATNDWRKRLQAHIFGTGAKYTRGRRPVELVYLVCRLTKSEALQYEARVKRLTRKQKLALIEGERDAQDH